MKTLNSQSMHTIIDPMRAQAMHAALDRSDAAPSTDDPLPRFWHWSQFWDIAPPDHLGRDGHPKTGGFIPDMGLPRRMWAGGALEFSQPILIGQAATRHSEILDVQKKTGQTGPLAFVTVSHQIIQNEKVCVREQQNLVYREDPDPNAKQAEAPIAPTDEEKVVGYTVTTTDLFRYSALTFNGHRIHYDLEYAKQVEGYPGLIIHGPLLAQRLIELAEDMLGGLKSFSFRAVSPVFHFERFEACANHSENGLSMFIRAPDGRLAMTAEARI